MKYLVSTVETYRVDTEEEAVAAIEEAKAEDYCILGKYSSEYKEKKLKGEVIEEYYKVVLTKIFNDIKEPDSVVKINYGI